MSNVKPFYTFKGRTTKIVKRANQDNSIVTGVKLRDQYKYETSNWHAGSNGTYLEFGEYHGMRMDVTFSLYDTDKNLIDLDGEKYQIERVIRFDIYDSCKQLLGFQRMSSQLYNRILSFVGKKSTIVFIVDEYEKQDDMAFARILVTSPFVFGEKVPTGKSYVSMKKVQ